MKYISSLFLFSISYTKGKGIQKWSNKANIGKQNVKRGVTSMLLTL